MCICGWVSAEPKRPSDLAARITGNCEPSDADVGIYAQALYTNIIR